MTLKPEDGNIAYAYLGRDINMQHLESSKAFLSAQEKGISPSELHEMRKRQGLLVLYSSRPIKRKDVLPIYYTRQQISEVFDICKNNTMVAWDNGSSLSVLLGVDYVEIIGGGRR